MENKIITVLICFLSVFTAKAEIKLPALFSDNMTLQQHMDAPIWGWAAKDESLSIITSWDEKVYRVRADKKGKWKTNLQTPDAGGPYTISVSNGNETKTINNVLIGEVWLCSGQSNMEMPLKGFPGQPVTGGNEAILHSKNNNIRFITVSRKTVLEKETDFEGGWNVANPSTTGNLSATAWFYGSLLQEILEVPIGLIDMSYNGSNVEAWMSDEMLKDFDSILPIPRNQEELKGNPNRKPTTLFNGMLSPVIGYGIKGALWYQGESNYERPFQYKKLLKKMVSSWRELWHQDDFPFYIAQIAPFDYARFHPDDYTDKYNSAYLREAQLQASKEIPNSEIAIMMDVGEFDNIHPADKKIGGERIAYLVLAKTYGMEGFEYQSPEFNAMEINDDTMVVSFKNIPNGVTSYNRPVEGFELAGKDKKFYPAKAVLRRKSVVLSSPEVKEPIAVRYLFKDFVVPEIFSVGGFPMSSFRTDDW